MKSPTSNCFKGSLLWSTLKRLYYRGNSRTWFAEEILGRRELIRIINFWSFSIMETTCMLPTNWLMMIKIMTWCHQSNGFLKFTHKGYIYLQIKSSYSWKTFSTRQGISLLNRTSCKSNVSLDYTISKASLRKQTLSKKLYRLMLIKIQKI